MTAGTSCRPGPRRGLGRLRLTAETVCGQRSTRGPSRAGEECTCWAQGARHEDRATVPPWAVPGFRLRGSRTGFEKYLCSCGLRERALQGLCT